MFLVIEEEEWLLEVKLWVKSGVLFLSGNKLGKVKTFSDEDKPEVLTFYWGLSSLLPIQAMTGKTCFLRLFNCQTLKRKVLKK